MPSPLVELSTTKLNRPSGEVSPVPKDDFLFTDLAVTTRLFVLCVAVQKFRMKVLGNSYYL